MRTKTKASNKGVKHMQKRRKREMQNKLCYEFGGAFNTIKSRREILQNISETAIETFNPTHASTPHTPTHTYRRGAKCVKRVS